MANLLTVPLKKTYVVDVKEPTRNYLEAHTDAHPEAFKADLNQWQQLRKDTVDVSVHVNAVEKLLKYHAQLLSIHTKLPADIGLEISYASVFPPNNLPVTLRNLGFERASVLFNLAALYSQLAAKEDRMHLEGIKRAISYYQNAAGTLAYLRNFALPKLVFSPQDEEIPLDLSTDFVHSIEWLMLAQAQECFWQKAKIDQFKSGLIARLAANTAAYYKLSISKIRDATPPIKHLFPSDWLAHIEAKEHHFDAVANFRKSMEEIDNSNYGHEIAYLQQAQFEAKRASEVARKGRVAAAVQGDIQSLMVAVDTSLKRAERDNDLIYHKDVPAISTLSPIPHAAIAQLTTPVGLSNPAKGVHMIMGEMLSWGAQEAINIYNDRKKNLVKDQISDKSKELRDTADAVLRDHNLPASLEALERPAGLPPIRMENGPTKIDSWFEDLQKQAKHVTNILDEAIDILDNEATEDEIARESGDLARPPSHKANLDLIQKEQRYRAILQQAALSDETVKQKWEEWEENIMDLIISEADLEALVPSSTSSKRRTPEAAVTQRYARNLRVLLESLDTVHADRAQIVRRAESLAEADDIRPRILKAATKLESLEEMQPAMFENVLDEELAKYDKYCQLLADNAQEQEDILSSIEADNEKFLSSRKDDPSIKEREHALQSLDLSYHKYREISGNLQEGIKVGLDVSLTQSMQSASLDDTDDDVEVLDDEDVSEIQEDLDMPSPPTKEPSEKAKGKMPVRLPPLSSSDWGFEEISLPPGPAEAKKKKSRVPI
ncbi:BRO1-domain-containing protein [Hymenopellis radicata]|nr:BRO1-domain-containing protein [Hymenopellis radicata]